jgi:phosphatidylglycerol---prolipoprotein diacylglyceryl transferase
MHPVLFEIFGFKLYSFGIMVALAFILSSFWIIQRAKAKEHDVSLYLDALSWIIISALLGARLCYFLFFPQEFWADPIRSFFSQGGLVWYGGMVGVSLTIIYFAKVKKLPLWEFSDVIVPPAALGLAIGRIGCFLSGCCFGGACVAPWAVHYPLTHETHGLGVHPSPLFESASMFITAWGLAQLYKHQRFDGQTTWAFFVVYGIVRFVLEYTRGDRLVWLPALDLSASQVISLLGVLLGAVMLVYLSKNKRKNSSSKNASSKNPTATESVSPIAG